VNDIDPEGLLELSSIVIIDQPQHGSLIVNNDGTVTYIHDGSDSTEDSFTYTIRDVEGLESNVATVSITIVPFNQPPVALDDEATVDEGASVLIDLAANDSDADGTLDLTSIEIVTQPLHGQVTINNDGTVTYTHDGSETTSDSFTYTIRDNGGKVSNVATVLITINTFDDAPVAVDDEAVVEQGETIIIDVAANDSDEEGPLDLTSIEIVDQPAHGTLQVNDDGTITYTHDGSDSTEDSFTYTIKDAGGQVSNVATVTITIVPFNQPPVAADDEATLDEGDSIIIDLAANDSDSDGTLDLTSIERVDQPLHGQININNDGTVTYTHDGSETTSDSFTYTIRDNGGKVSNIATVTLTINPVDDAPVAMDDEAEVDQGQSIVINVAANDSDEEGPLDLTSIEIVDQPSHGTLQVNDDGTVTYTHDGSNTTSDTFTYTIRDANGNISNQAKVTIVIILANQAPVAVDDIGSVANGESVVINVAENDTDADGTIDLTSIEIVDQPSHGTVQINDDGTVTYTHDGSASDTDSFTYTIRDNLGLISNVATVNITIS
ncbi:MAG TPA: Ig-like domain-containing protein, partial [Gemmatales bacterium]|nr:Ig-like domain-containing protein [Gemmatales bacterium]